MNNSKFKFEDFPNEIIIHIFDYFDGRYIFQAFYDLNYRFNKLIQSLKNLRIIISEKNNHDLYQLDDFSSSYIETLIIKDEIYIHVKDLDNVRHVLIYCSSDSILTQINTSNFPYLEYFSISNNILVKSNVYKQIFSNTFSNLKYCNLCGSVSRQVKPSKASFFCLKMGGIDFDIYKTILLACPNLYYFKFRMLKSNIKSIFVESHMNLKQLIIDIEISGWPCNDQSIDRFLEIVPNLEQLNIYSSNFIAKIKESIINYDWLASIISNRLLLLKRFIFFFRLNWSAMSNELKDRNIINQLETNFSNAHITRYQSRFVIKLLN